MSLFKIIVCLLNMGIAMPTTESGFNNSAIHFVAPPQISQKSDTKNDETGKWRKLSNGETVPAGSSVKVDLQTGEKLIKVNIDDDTKNGKNILKVQGFATWNDVKYGLKQIKNRTLTKDEKPQAKSNRTDYRDMKIILQELGKFDFASKTETGILSEFLKNYTMGNLAYKLEILEEIEFLVHKYSFGQALVKLGGLEIFKKDVYETKNFTHKAMIVMTLGSALQGNPLVKEAVLASNFTSIFIDFLTSEVDILQLRSTFALSALLRNYQPAQNVFFKLKGYSVLADILNGKYSPSLKLLTKIVILMSDLLHENDPAEYSEKEIQEIGLTVSVLEHRRNILYEVISKYNMCSAFSSLLSSENDVIVEHVIKISLKVKHICFEELLSVLPRINNLALLYCDRRELEKENGDSYAYNTTLCDNLDEIIQFLRKKFLKNEL